MNRRHFITTIVSAAAAVAARRPKAEPFVGRERLWGYPYAGFSVVEADENDPIGSPFAEQPYRGRGLYELVAYCESLEP